MKTSVNSSQDMRAALNENLQGLLSGKREITVVKEVNNTLGKMLVDVKMELMQKALIGERTGLSWFDRNVLTAGKKLKK